MSLSTDSIFLTALRSNADLMKAIGAKGETPPRLYGTAIPLPDEDVENVPEPYLIVTFDGLANNPQTKDDLYEGFLDEVNIGIIVSAKTLTALHDLTEEVRKTILSYFRENKTNVMDYTMSAEPIQYENSKPAYWQILKYKCETYS